MMENRKILNPDDLDGFDKVKMASFPIANNSVPVANGLYSSVLFFFF